MNQNSNVITDIYLNVIKAFQLKLLRYKKLYINYFIEIQKEYIFQLRYFYRNIRDTNLFECNYDIVTYILNYANCIFYYILLWETYIERYRKFLKKYIKFVERIDKLCNLIFFQ